MEREEREGKKGAEKKRYQNEDQVKRGKDVAVAFYHATVL